MTDLQYSSIVPRIIIILYFCEAAFVCAGFSINVLNERTLASVENWANVSEPQLLRFDLEDPYILLLYSCFNRKKISWKPE